MIHQWVKELSVQYSILLLLLKRYFLLLNPNIRLDKFHGGIKQNRGIKN